MVTAIRLLLFFISNLGWWEVIRKKTDVSVFFIPSLAIAIQVSILFLCGLLNLLPEGAYALCLGGICVVIYKIWKNREARFSNFIRPYCNAGFLFFVILLIAIALSLKGKIFTHYDNFSHWALVVKRMLEINRYPNFKDVIIFFPAYPLGSATFIYYFAKIVGSAESLQMLAQVYFMLTCILPLFIFAEKSKFCGFIIILSATNFFLTYNIPVSELLVDTLLPLAGMCGILFAVLYCGKSCDEKKAVAAAYYAVLVVQVKNSGLLFAVVISVWILFYARKIKISFRMLCAAAPFFSFALWKRHCDYVFDSAEWSRHALSFSNYKTVYAAKSSDEIRTIAKSMLQFIVSFKDMWFTLLMFLILGIMILLFAKKEFSLFKRGLLASLILYMVYQIGMLGMYIFSMPGEEATSLAENVRYAKTIIIAIVYLYLVLALKTVSAIDRSQKTLRLFSTTGIALLICLFLFLSVEKVQNVLNNTYLTDPSKRLWFEAAIKEYNVPPEESYSILAPENDGGYSYFLGRYILQSTSISYVVADDTSELDRIKGDYIFVYDDDNELIKTWIAEKYPEQIDARVIITGK